MAALLTAASICAGCGEDRPRPGYLARQTPPVHIAHRGGAGELPENTLYAFDFAITHLGSDVIEVDVRRTGDGHLVIIHDEHPTLGGLDGMLAVRQMSLAQLRGLPIDFPASGGIDPRLILAVADPRLLRVPTLEEVVQRYRNCLINIEVKDDDPGVADQVLATLKNPSSARLPDELAGRICLASFHDRVSRRLREQAPETCHTYPLQAGIATALPRVLAGPRRAPDYDLFAVPDGAAFRSLLGDLRGRGKAVYIWTVDDKARMRQLLDWGVDGIMTDYPSRLREVFDERGLMRRQDRESADLRCEIAPFQSLPPDEARP